MYFVNRSEIEEILNHMDDLLDEVKDATVDTSRLEKLGLERLVHLLIESMLDVGNMMIDGFIMRDPGSYHDIIDILIDEQVLPANEEDNYKAIIDLRKMLVQDYLTIDCDQLQTTYFANKTTLDSFSNHIRYYLDNELGVANAFSNES